MSDRNKLLAAATKLGCPGVGPRSTADELRAAIAEKLGDVQIPGASEEQANRVSDSYAEQIADDSMEVAGATGPVTAPAHNIPNLTPTGKWQGKRAKILRVKTGVADMGGAIFRWNGWPTLIPLDVECDVAWPIFEIIKNTVGLRAKIQQEVDPQNPAKVNNRVITSKYQKYPYQFLGVTPGTEDLPESGWEYTLDEYVNDFEGFTLRMWRQLCTLWEIADAEAGVKPGMNPDEELTVRRNSVHFKLNLPMEVDRSVRLRVRNQKRADIGMPAKAA